MAQLTRQKIRARISFGNIDVSTPNIMSFHVTRQRGQASATFSASIKIDSSGFFSSNAIIGDSIVIEAGTSGSLRTIFTGKIYKCTVNPIRTDASKIMLNLAGSDVISVMQNQHITRRVKSYKDGTRAPERWAAVTQVTHPYIEIIKKWPNRIVSPKKAAANLNYMPGMGDVVYTPTIDMSDKLVDRSVLSPSEGITTEIDNSDME
ncbi:MAG: hypothetical protein DRH15_04195 [Deltaproteobacteria bacterium]|nr:MAG: hypothetical protein DRH15_04195 [Deltaproteobacteria bacterium]